MVRAGLRRVTAWIATVAFVATLGLPLVASRHLMPDDDPACVRTWQPAAHPVSQFEPVREPVSDGHCAVCHWLRALGASVTSARHRCPLISTLVADHSPDTPAIRAGVSGGDHARGPPSTT